MKLRLLGIFLLINVLIIPSGLCRRGAICRVLFSAGDGEDRSSGECTIF